MYLISASFQRGLAPLPEASHRPDRPLFSHLLIVALTVCSWHLNICAMVGTFNRQNLFDLHVDFGH
jgi:hypothetical protein